MLNPPTHLTIRRPSPTTVSFTASNAPLRTSLSLHVIFYSTILLRVLLGLSVLLITVAKITDTPRLIDVWRYEKPLLGGSLGRLATSVADRISWRVLIPTTTAIIYVVFRKGYPEESLLVLRGLGIQTSTSSTTYLSTSTTRFIPTNQIQDIFIHEAFKGFEVRFYLAVVVEGEGEVVVVFPVSGMDPLLSRHLASMASGKGMMLTARRYVEIIAEEEDRGGGVERGEGLFV